MTRLPLPLTMEATMPMKPTPQQVENAMKYGLCRTCGAPRETRMTDETDARGNRTVSYGIVCPNGHPQ